MAIPDFQSLMLPLLRFATKGESHVRNAVDDIGAELALNENELAELLPSGKQTTFANRVHWAKSYLGKAGLIELTKRGHFKITERGKTVLTSPPARIDIKYLTSFEEFQRFRSDQTIGNEDTQQSLSNLNQFSVVELTPDEQIRAAWDTLESELSAELLRKVVSGSPSFFERLVVNLLTAMGYGGSPQRTGRALGKAGDGGVDGVIDQDALGLERIYVQAKKYASDNPVGPGAIRDFFGALDQFKAGKGLFVTTSTFTASAVKTSEGLSKRIVLIDGQHLARLMIAHGVGCRIEETVVIKKIDEEFFE